ncbi:hypothetical protein EJ07DRAFT_152961 [Lizonia empirigonia]|nr:hypothetical protein EJ07DRAFT_152961 [Lizonia empirigonia]
MTGHEQYTIPTDQSAFTFAVRPFYSEHVDHLINLSLPSPTETESSIEAILFPNPPESTEPLVKPVILQTYSPHSEHFKGYQTDTPACIEAKHGPIAILRCTQIQTMLMRCQILQSAIHGLEGKPWVKHRDELMYQHYQTMRELTYKARQLAKGAQSQALQARCEYWAGCACAGTNDFFAALEHFRRACSGGTGGLRCEEAVDVHALLRGVERCVEAVQRNNGVLLDSERGWSAQAELRKWTAREQLYVRCGSKAFEPLTLKEELLGVAWEMES